MELVTYLIGLYFGAGGMFYAMTVGIYESTVGPKYIRYALACFFIWPWILKLVTKKEKKSSDKPS